MNTEQYAAAVMKYATERLDNVKGVRRRYDYKDNGVRYDYDYEADLATGVMRALDDLIDFLKELNSTNNIKN